MKNLLKFLIRSSSFLRKEIFEVLRQPRLLLTLIAGPFLILLIFGLGYSNQARALRTLFVVQPGSQLKGQIEEYARSLGPQLIFEGVSENETSALTELRQGRVDLVAVSPENALQTIRSNHQAVFKLYHNEIDPFQVDYVKYFGQVYIDELNRRVLTAVTRQGQLDAQTVRADIRSAHQDAVDLRQALQAGDLAMALQKRSDLTRKMDRISAAVGASLGVLSGVEQTVGGGKSSASALLDTLDHIRQNLDLLGSGMSTTSGASGQDLQTASQIETDLNSFESRLGEFTSIDPQVLVRPFTSETYSVAPSQPSPLDFYIPAVIALLLQHLAITFSALSIVRERSVGTLELFRVSPLSAGEALLGKYLSYLFFGGLLTVVLTLLVIYFLKLPMLGSWQNYGLVIAAILFTSLGFGFVISLISDTDSQAVQYAMIVLLASVFFSGFLMNLDQISRPVRAVSWSLPTTYGIILLRDIVLRGQAPERTLLGGLIFIGLGLCFLAWLLLRRLISAR